MGDDFYHHEGAFRSAAMMHYSAMNGGSADFTGFHEWYWAQSLSEAEQKALAYLRATYFDKNDQA